MWQEEKSQIWILMLRKEWGNNFWHMRKWDSVKLGIVRPKTGGLQFNFEKNAGPEDNLYL